MHILLSTLSVFSIESKSKYFSKLFDLVDRFCSKDENQSQIKFEFYRLLRMPNRKNRDIYLVRGAEVNFKVLSQVAHKTATLSYFVKFVKRLNSYYFIRISLS
jgi:hypothetical protein